MMGTYLILPAQLAHAGPSNTPPADCSSSFDPYAYTQSAVASCGYATFPLASVTPMAGGGSQYSYDINGADAYVYVPPAGFSPTTATDAQLAEYGFPPRPTDPTALQQWQEEFSNWTGAATPPPFLTESNGTSGDRTSGTWSGYMIQGTLNTFTQAETTFIEPDKSYPSSCSTYGEVTWAGLGGWNNNDALAQDGTYIGNALGDISSHQSWWEIYPQGPITPTSLNASPDGHFDASTRYVGNGTYRFFMYNYATGKSWVNDYESFDGHPDETAEAIAERPTNGATGHATNLTNFGTLTFSWAKANDEGFDTYSPSGVRYAVNMYDNQVPANAMAIPSEIGNIGYFTDTQHDCN
jgi:hypothetical protein